MNPTKARVMDMKWIKDRCWHFWRRKVTTMYAAGMRRRYCRQCGIPRIARDISAPPQ